MFRVKEVRILPKYVFVSWKMAQVSFNPAPKGAIPVISIDRCDDAKAFGNRKCCERFTTHRDKRL